MHVGNKINQPQIKTYEQYGKPFNVKGKNYEPKFG